MKRILSLLAAALLAAPALSLAAVLNDEVTSAKLREADNNGSQDTNSGNGVKTNHIQNKAVTGAKMADGTITATQLANGAVTDAKISGTISAAKLGAHTHPTANVLGLDAALASKADLATVYQRFDTVVVVSPDGRGDFTDPVAAMAAITDASAAKPYLVKLLPGVYTVSSPIVMQPFVDIEGSGRGVTTIVGAAMELGENLIELAGGSELRSLSLSTDSAWFTLHGSGRVKDVAILVTGSPDGNSRTAAALTGPVKLQDVDVVVRSSPGTYLVNAVNIVSGDGDFDNLSVDASGGTLVYALTVGAEATATLDHVTLLASAESTASALEGYGDARVRDSRLAAEGAALAYGSSLYGIDVANSEVAATATTAIAVLAGRSPSNRSAKIANTQITGQLSKQNIPGTYFKCIGVHDADLVPVACPQ